MERAEALEVILANWPEGAPALFATGVISRAAQHVSDRAANLYVMGSMGLVSSVGLGVALARPGQPVMAVEGDGGLLMELGTLPLAAHLAPANYLHVILDNGAYESTGGQATISRDWTLSDAADRCGYRQVARASSPGELAQAVRGFVAEPAGPSLVHVKTVSRPAAPFPPRIFLSPEQLTERFRGAVLK